MGENASARETKWISHRDSEHQGITGNEETDTLAIEGTNGVPSDKTIGIYFVVGNEVLMESFETGTPEQVEKLAKFVASPRP